MKKVKVVLEKYPRINRIVRSVCLPLAMKCSGLKQYFIRNKLGDLWTHRGGDWADGYWESREHSHRSYLVDRIAEFSLVTSVLEIGCASGPNLYLLAKRFPDAEIEGIEINPEAVRTGNERLSESGVSNVKLSEGRAEDLSRFKDNSFDVVFTDAVLIYIGRNVIQEVTENMLRIARKGLVMMEHHYFEPRKKNGGREFTIPGEPFPIWVRDYRALLTQFVPDESIRIDKLTDEIWEGESEGKYRALIQVNLSQS